MKKRFLPIALILALPLACATLPEPRIEDLTQGHELWPDLRLEDLSKGRALYRENCAGCHALHLPAEFHAEKWRNTMERMQRKAKINDDTRDGILKYVLTYARKD